MEDIPPKAASGTASPPGNGTLDGPLIKATSGTSGTVLFVQAGSPPLPPEHRDNRDTRPFDPQPWTRGGLNE